MNTYQRACLPEEYDWAVQGGGEVEGCVGVSFASGALAKVADHDLPVLGALEGISTADSCKISENLSEPLMERLVKHNKDALAFQKWLVRFTILPGCLAKAIRIRAISVKTKSP